jgi:pyruvate dehydrogenase E2 component (dihydrolipoamide acetyltransferase)
MAVSVVMPALEMAQESGKLLAWLKKEGDAVSKGEPLLEIETDKAVLEIEAPADGVLAGVTGEAGTDIPVGHTIAWIVAPGESVPIASAPPLSVAAAVTESPRPAETAAKAAEISPPRMSPKARRLAKEAGIDLSAIRGSGPDGEILASDVQVLVDAKTHQALPGAPLVAAAQTGAVPAQSAHHEHPSAIARLMAERTTHSWTTVPHFYLQRDVDAEALNAARTAWSPGIEQTHGVRLTHTDILIALVARSLARHPRVNASWTGDSVAHNPQINIAIAVAVDDGVVAPVVPRADAISLGEIAIHRHDLMGRARANRLRPSDLQGGTFTISNLGMLHIDSFCAIITPPQAAVLAVGQIADRVVPLDGTVAIRPMFSLTLSCDHRVIDGAKAAGFLHDLAQAIHAPGDFLP